MDQHGHTMMQWTRALGMMIDPYGDVFLPTPTDTGWLDFAEAIDRRTIVIVQMPLLQSASSAFLNLASLVLQDLLHALRRRSGANKGRLRRASPFLVVLDVFSPDVRSGNLVGRVQQGAGALAEPADADGHQ